MPRFVYLGSFFILYRYNIKILEFLLFPPLKKTEKRLRCFPFSPEKDTAFLVPHDCFSSFPTSSCVNFGRWSGMWESSDRLKLLDYAFCSVYKHTFMCVGHVLALHTQTQLHGINKWQCCDGLQVHSWALVSMQCHVWQWHPGARCEVPDPPGLYPDWGGAAWGGMWGCEATNRTSLSPGVLWQWSCPLHARITTCWRWQCDLWLGIYRVHSMFSHMSWRYLLFFLHLSWVVRIWHCVVSLHRLLVLP